MQWRMVCSKSVISTCDKFLVACAAVHLGMNPAACSLYEYSPLVVMPRVAFFVNEPGAGSSFGKIVVSNISTAAVSCGRTYKVLAGMSYLFVFPS